MSLEMVCLEIMEELDPEVDLVVMDPRVDLVEIMDPRVD